MAITSVKGTRDFYPENLGFRNFLAKHLRAAATSFGYVEWDSPILEPFELYAAKSGDELVNEQAFVMEDRGGRKIVLRPELTPSLARLVSQRQQALGKPLRWFSFGPMWRYEQPQRGRAREFWQWNVDMLGINSPKADAELIAVAIHFLTSLGLSEKDFVIKVSDRVWFKQMCQTLAIGEELLPEVLHAVDRIDKMPEEKWKTYVATLGLEQKQVEALYETIQTSRATDIKKLKTSDWLKEVFDTLKHLGLLAFVEADISVVRGLDYYTATVFEVRDRKGILRAIGGGGRYENLVEQVGGSPLSAVGFAMGDMPLEELLKEVNKYPTQVIDTPVVLVTVFESELFENSLNIANQLRATGINTELYISDKDSHTALDKQLKYADNKNIPFAVILGLEEVKNATVVLKNLNARTQETVPLAELISNIKTQLTSA